MKQKRYGSYGVTFYPKGAEKLDWKGFSKSEISYHLSILGFLTPLQLGKLLNGVSIKGEKRRNGEGYYYSTLEDFTGQLELGTENNKPHYQMIIEVKPKVTKAKLLKYFSQLLYGQSKSSAISVTVLTENTEAYEDYCTKEARANLPGEYEHIIIDSSISFFVNYVEENPQLKKFLKARTLFKYG